MVQSWTYNARLAWYFIKGVRDPSSVENVFNASAALASTQTVSQMLGDAASSAVAWEAIRTRRRLGTIDLGELRKLPEGSFGRTFADHMQRSNLDPATLVPIDAADDVQYIRAHLRESHDIWHVVTGHGTDLAGELGLKGFHFAQMGARTAFVAIVGGLLNTLLYAYDDRHERLRDIVRGYTLGCQAKPLFGVAWAELWSTPLAEVRASLGLDVAGVERSLGRVARR